MCSSSNDRVINPWILQFHPGANLERYFCRKRAASVTKRAVFGCFWCWHNKSRVTDGVCCVCVCCRVTATRAGYSMCLIWIYTEGVWAEQICNHFTVWFTVCRIPWADSCTFLVKKKNSWYCLKLTDLCCAFNELLLFLPILLFFTLLI